MDVMDDLMADKDRGAKRGERIFDGPDRPFDAGAKPARRRQAYKDRRRRLGAAE